MRVQGVEGSGFRARVEVPGVANSMSIFTFIHWMPNQGAFPILREFGKANASGRYRTSPVITLWMAGGARPWVQKFRVRALRVCV